MPEGQFRLHTYSDHRSPASVSRKKNTHTHNQSIARYANARYAIARYANARYSIARYANARYAIARHSTTQLRNDTRRGIQELSNYPTRLRKQLKDEQTT